MSLDPDLIRAAVKGGLSVICASCNRYWEGRARGLPEPRCTSKDGCGSPLSGGDFHEYDGPISDFGRWCFVCAESAKYGVRARGKEKVFGVCESHVRLLHDLKPVDVSVPEPVLSGTLKVPEKRSLAAVIQSVEDQFASKGRG